MNAQPLDLVSKIMDYEQGQMIDEEIVEFFQEMIDSGIVWSLQSCYGRMAKALIAEGSCHFKKGIPS